MPFAAPGLRVSGLDETVRGLRKAGQDLPKVLAGQHKEHAVSVQQGAQTRLAAQPVPKRTGVIGRSATARQASVTLKAARYPWAMGAEFGALQYPQFKKWRGNQFTPATPGGPGYLIQPEIAEQLPRMADSYADAVLAAFRRHLATR